MVGVLVAALDNPVDLVMLLLVAFLLFGKQLPEVARTVGKGIRDLRENLNLDEMADAFSEVNEIRTTVSPQTIARAAIPGIAEMQDTVGAVKGLANPFEGSAAAMPGEVASAEPEQTAPPRDEPEPSPTPTDAG
jgi:Sec-independent protein translocase protein TatA